MKLLTSTPEISTPRHQRYRCSWLVSLLLAASVLLSVFTQPANGKFIDVYGPVIGIEFIPNPDVETLSGLDSNIGLASAIRKGLNITDKNQALTVADMESLTHVDLYDLGISSLVGLEHATNLTYLGFGRTAISDLTPLKGLTKLESLSLGGNRISDLTPLKGLTKLEQLRLGHNRISDLTPLKGLTKLELIYVQYNRISDLTPLKDMTQLTDISVGGNRITDLTPLKGLTNLDGLSLFENQITDLTPLSGLTQLESLTLENNKIRDISPLSGLSNLWLLFIHSNHIASIEPIKPLMESGTLTTLRSGGNPFSAADIEFITNAGLVHVWDVFERSPEIDEADIPNDTLRAALQALDGAPETLTHQFISGLTSLDLSGKDIGNFTGLEAAINLTSLTLNDTGMTNRRLSKLTEILVQLPRLTELNLGNGKITNVSPLAGLTRLTKLHLHDNTIADVTPLTSLTNLIELHLNDNRIASIEGLKTLTGLQVLNLNGNHRVADVSPLSGLTSLTHLFLSRNRIADVSPLNGLTNLQELTLDRNRIADFTPIASLTSSLQDYHNEDQKVDPVAKIPDTNLRKAVLTALGRNPDTDTAPIKVSEMATLTNLSATNASISNLTGLQHAVNLKTLDLSGNALDDDDVSRLLRLTQLETLILLDNDNITNAKPFRKLKNLTTLRLPTAIATEDPVVAIPDAGLRTAILRALGLSEAPETEITESDLHDLENLQASGYGISDLTGLEHATHLRALYLNDNQISDLSAISGLDGLRRLSLNNNNISDVTDLSGVTTLRWLRLSDNRISAVGALDNLTLLHTLELSNNRISDVNALTALTKLNNLSLDHNPIDVDSLPASLIEHIDDTPGVQATSFNLLDVNRDGSVNQEDIDIVSRLMGMPSGDLASVENTSGVYPDVDGDGDVDEADVAAVTASVSGQPTGPDTSPGAGSGGSGLN